MAEITKDELDEAAEGQTVPMRFLRTVAAHPDQVALRAKDGDGWVEVDLPASTPTGSPWSTTAPRGPRASGPATGWC